MLQQTDACPQSHRGLSRTQVLSCSGRFACYSTFATAPVAQNAEQNAVAAVAAAGFCNCSFAGCSTFISLSFVQDAQHRDAAEAKDKQVKQHMQLHFCVLQHMPISPFHAGR